MISDVLHEAVVEMDRYLDNPEWRDTYTGQTRKELKALRTMMDAARQRLDTTKKFTAGGVVPTFEKDMNGG